MIMIPLIKVKDRDGIVHTVGTDSHDALLVGINGGIQYFNLQNLCGTEEFFDDKETAEYKFLYDNSREEYGFYEKLIEFVPITEAVEIAIKESDKNLEVQRQLTELFKKLEDKHKENEENKKGLIKTIGGGLTL